MRFLILLLSISTSFAQNYECRTLKSEEATVAFLRFPSGLKNSSIEAEYRNGYPAYTMVNADLVLKKKNSATLDFVSKKYSTTNYHASFSLPVNFLSLREFPFELSLLENTTLKFRHPMHCQLK